MEHKRYIRSHHGMTVEERVLQLDHIQARRLRHLPEDVREIAFEGIIRHLKACAKIDVNPDASAIREIIDDAVHGRKIYAETNNDLLTAMGFERPVYAVNNPEQVRTDDDEDSELSLQN